jgi:hypothetical protein
MDVTHLQGARKDVITLFHAPTNPASMRVHTLLKQTAGAANSTATIDQAGDHSNQSKTERTEFDLGECGQRNEEKTK